MSCACELDAWAMSCACNQAVWCRHGYLSELGSREYLPMFWTEEELGLLQGTTVAQNAMVRKMGALSFTDVSMGILD